MKVYAALKNGIVENIINADDEQALEVLSVMLPDNELILMTEETGHPFIGYGFKNGRFITAQPHPGWIWADQKFEWVSPVAKPKTGSYEWDRETESWVTVPN